MTRFRGLVAVLALFALTATLPGCSALGNLFGGEQSEATKQNVSLAIGSAMLAHGQVSQTIAVLVRPVKKGGLGKMSVAQGQAWLDQLERAAALLKEARQLLASGDETAATEKLVDAQDAIGTVQDAVTVAGGDR